MTKQETTQDLTFKLSANNSLLTLPSGQSFQLTIDYALVNFFEELPKDFDLKDLHTEILSIQDELMDHIPDDFPMARYKAMHRYLTATAVFFQFLFTKGGNHA